MTERNNALLSRLDERTENMEETLKNIEAHLARLNGNVNKNTTSCGKNRSHINIQWYLISGIILGLMACGFKFIGVY